MTTSKGGRPRKPTALKVIEGTARKDRLVNEPVPPPKPPTMPGWLSDEAKLAWKRMAPGLHERGLLSTWDREAFAVLCEAIAQHRQACELVSGSNVLIKGYRGSLVKNPALQVVRDTSQTIRAFAQEFGLTPSARSAIDMPESGAADDLLGILDG